MKDGEAVPEALRPHVAAGVQHATEEAVIRLAGEGRNLCVAGGLGLNALLVSALEARSGFENVFVQPAAGNAGGAIGAVLDAWHGAFRQTKRVRMETACLGPSFSAPEIKQVLENCKLRFQYFVTSEELIETAVGSSGTTKSWRGCTGGWSSGRGRWGIGVFWRRR